MGYQIINVLSKYSRFLRHSLVFFVSLSFLSVVLTIYIELRNPGSGAQSIYATLSYCFMGASFLFSIPLWLLKIDNYTNNANKQPVDTLFAQSLWKLRYQIAVGIAFALILYFLLSHFLITPEFQEQYRQNLTEQILISKYNITESNISVVYETDQVYDVIK